ncbi:HlyD family efflux transporter periplasmic adaptor subunit [Cyanobium sp. HWJ4-Hawea]|uniref:HlyD family efflux transporter periplasmic adaptor subunit n=1 Tax=Cyanobium sp. HWJ4-Hawea TaxID=2823713 RepID=UPI0020CBA4F7|nr:HlyD family efflux transporter periplasmic adaptor subunit [Cyanobium sp. HWJ4-Hawea]MCP9809134.1 HlyD family efflux transporter periplasmic adaptor subunit [Cyanobium sp. HWJ4-Hawea]
MPQFPESSEILLRLRKRFPRLLSKPNSDKVFYDSPGLLDQSNHWAGLVIWTIAAGTTAALLWAFLGKVDQTVSASGTLEPSLGKVDVRSTTGGIVKRLWVKEGQEVYMGQPLVEIENLGLRARLQTAGRQLDLLRYENLLLNLLIDRSGSLPSQLPPPPSSLAQEDRIRSIQLSVQEKAAQMRQLRFRLQSVRETLRLKQEISKSLSPLFKNGGMAKYDYLRSLDEVQQMSSQISQTREQLNILVSEAARNSSANDRQILNLEAERTGLQESSRNLILRSTGAGRVFNLSFRPGSVIASGTELMRIVPEGSLRARLFLANTDLGFVRQGQKAKLTVSSFPASEYGYLNGRVTRIGVDALDSTATTDQRRADTFPLQVTLEDNPSKAGLIGKLRPGMQVVALISIRQRPVITLLTDTFTKGTESLQNSR